MNEEFDTLIEEAAWKTVETINVAIAIGGYKKANELLEVLRPKKNEKKKSLEDNMVA